MSMFLLECLRDSARFSSLSPEDCLQVATQFLASLHEVADSADCEHLLSSQRQKKSIKKITPTAVPSPGASNQTLDTNSAVDRDSLFSRKASSGAKALPPPSPKEGSLFSPKEMAALFVSIFENALFANFWNDLRLPFIFSVGSVAGARSLLFRDAGDIDWKKFSEEIFASSFFLPFLVVLPRFLLDQLSIKITHATLANTHKEESVSSAPLGSGCSLAFLDSVDSKSEQDRAKSERFSIRQRFRDQFFQMQRVYLKGNVSGSVFKRNIVEISENCCLEDLDWIARNVFIPHFLNSNSIYNLSQKQKIAKLEQRFKIPDAGTLSSSSHEMFFFKFLGSFPGCGFPEQVIDGSFDVIKKNSRLKPSLQLLNTAQSLGSLLGFFFQNSITAIFVLTRLRGLHADMKNSFGRLIFSILVVEICSRVSVGSKCSQIMAEFLEEVFTFSVPIKSVADCEALFGSLLIATIAEKFQISHRTISVQNRPSESEIDFGVLKYLSETYFTNALASFQSSFKAPSRKIRPNTEPIVSPARDSVKNVQQELFRWFLWKYPLVKSSIDSIVPVVMENFCQAFLMNDILQASSQSIWPTIKARCLEIYRSMFEKLFHTYNDQVISASIEVALEFSVSWLDAHSKTDDT